MGNFDFDFDANEETTTGNVFGHLDTADEIDADYASREAELAEELADEYISEEEMDEALEALNNAMVERLMEITTSMVNENDLAEAA